MQKKNAEEISVSLKSGGTMVNGGTVYTVSADAPYTISAKGSKTGISADVVQPVLTKYGEIKTAGYVKVYGTFDDSDKGTKDGTKETKVALTLEAAGSTKKVSFKSTVIGKVVPYFEKTAALDADDATKAYIQTKRVEAGKVPSVSFKPKGSKTITYSIDEASQAALEEVGLSFDIKKGAVVALDSKNKSAIVATVSDDEFASIDIAVTATNSVGSATAYAEVAVTGAKPSLTKASQKLTLARTDYNAGDVIILSCDVNKEAIDKSNTDNKITYAVADDDKSEKALSEIGLTLTTDTDNYRNYGILTVGENGLTATKGAKAALVLNNFGATNKGNITIVITDPAPEIDGEATISATASTSGKVEETLALALTDATAPTDGAKITWKAGKLSDSAPSGLKVAVKADTTDSSKATLTLTVPKDCEAYTGTVEITATNGNSKLAGTKEVSIAVAAVATEGTLGVSSAVVKGNGTSAAPEAAPEAKSEEAEANANAEAKAVFGAPRTIANISAGQASFIAEKGYTVVAVLPEITAEGDGQVEIPVELDENAPEGAKLLWLAFPKNAEASDDDEIADFYDDAGAQVEGVPASRKIIVSPWLRDGVTYEPVIAVEAK